MKYVALVSLVAVAPFLAQVVAPPVASPDPFMSLLQGAVSTGGTGGLMLVLWLLGSRYVKAHEDAMAKLTACAQQIAEALKKDGAK